MLLAAHSPPVALRAQPASNQRLQLDAYPVPALPVSIPVTAPARTQMRTQTHTHALPEAPAPVSVHERLLAAQLAHLASQHHASEYSKLKFGNEGSPFAYVPLSLQSPALVRELQVRQAESVAQKAWWPSDQTLDHPPEDSHDDELTPEDETRMADVPVVNTREQGQTLPTMMTTRSSDLQQEISAAISSQIPCIPAPPATHITKTSQTHPINISMVIPYELMPAIATQLSRAPKSSPFMFHLPQNCHLDRVTAVPMSGAYTSNPVRRGAGPLFPASSHPGISQPFHTHPPIMWGQPSGGELLRSALHGEITFALPGVPLPLSQAFEKNAAPTPPPPFLVPSQMTPRRLMTESPPVPAELPPSHSFPLPTPPSPPKGVIRRQPRHERATSAPPSLQLLKGAQRKSVKELSKAIPHIKSNPEVPTSLSLSATSPVVPSFVLESKADTSTSVPESNAREEKPRLNVALTQDIAHTKNADGRRLMFSPRPRPHFFPSGAPVQRLGNLFLSSCPGKKVRLSGPVKGRGAICRDLRADLNRVKNLGVGCIICCLDDSELEFLGASWSEYSCIANDLGLDVLRLPTPEGLAPLTPASLDAHLGQLIESYTLVGTPILVHCRGGVGRAGLIACCWMLKLGLCGWKDTDLCARTHGACTASSEFAVLTDVAAAATTTAAASFGNAPGQGTGVGTMAVPRVCRATVQLVERAISVVRRRRSLKAVETYEQVRFLVDFVEHIDARAGADCDVD